MGRKAKAASSAKALEVCGDTSRLGVSAADVFAQFNAPINSYSEEPQSVALDDVEVSLALQALQKKDPTTRLRNVQELHQLLSTRSTQKLIDICAPFLQIYRRLWPQDSEPRVREGLQRCLQVLVDSLQRDFQQQLRSAFPTWLCAMFDTHTEVAQAARCAFRSAFSEEKRRGVFRHSLRECLELLRSNLKHSEQSLHDELGILQQPLVDKDNALERQDRYARVVASSLHALGELVQVCSSPMAPDQPGAARATLSAEQLQPFLEAGSPCAVWPRLSSKQPTAIRRAAVHCLVRILRCEADMGLACATSTNRAAALNVMADEHIAASSAAALVLAFAAAGERNNCWEGLDAGKALWPQLSALLRRAKSGAPGDADEFLTQFQELVQVFPKSAWMSGKAESLLREILEALATPRAAFAGHALKSWKAYFAVCRASGIPVESCCRWHPLLLYLGQPIGTDSVLPEVFVPRPVLAALCGAVGQELPLMSLEVQMELVQLLSDGVPPIEALDVPSAVSSSSCKSSWRSWLQMLQPLLKSQDLAKKALDLLTTQIRRLFLVLLRSAGASHHFSEALEALSVLLMCEDGPWSLEDKELQDCVASLTGGAGRADLSDWPEEAHLLAWPLLPWWCSLMETKAELAEVVGRKILKPFLEVLPRKCTDAARCRELMLKEVLSKNTLSEGSTGALAFRLCLETLADYSPFESEQVRQGLQELIDRVAKGDLSPGMDEVLSALHVALVTRFRVTAASDSAAFVQWMKVVVSAATEPTTEKTLQLRLILLVAKAITAQDEMSEQWDIHQLMEPLCRALLKTLISSEDADAWSMLSKLLTRLDPEQASQLLAESGKNGSGGNWLRILLEGSSVTSLSPLSLLCKARQGHCREDSTSHLLPRGAISSQQLRDSAMAAARLLQEEKNSDLVLLERQEPVVLEVFWEVLLAVTSGATDDDVALQGARKIWSFLKEAPRDSKMNFLQLCIKESSSEGNSWWLDLGDREVLDALPVSASLSSLAVLRRVLEALWCDATAAEELGDSILSSCFTGLEASHPRAGWGFAYAAVLKRLWEVDAICQDRALALRSEMRLRMQDLCEKKKISEPLLAFTAALEAPVVCAAKVPKAALFKVDVSTGPLITEAAGGEESVAKNEEPVDDLDTGLVDLMEKFLRWSQSSDSAAQRSDALAAFAARAWTSVAGSSSGTTKMSQRMTRLALENLGITGGPVLASPGKTLPVTPGVWRLIAVLCGHGQWPQNHWPALLQSLIKGNAWLSEHLGTVSVAFIDDAFEALSDLLHWAPVENSVESLATLLAASDKRLRSAAAKRLQAHVWVPARLGISSQPWSNNGMSASDALSQFEQLLQSDAPPEVDAGANGIAPSVGDVSYTVSDALESLATWEASADSESEGEDYHSHRGQRMREGYGSPPVMEGTTTPSSSSRCRKMPWMDDGDELPVETAKCCVASIAAWETLLKGIDRGVQEGASAGSSREKPEESTPSPACLLAALLQLNPDQLAPDHAKVFPSQAAPQSQWSSPLQPLLRLLCHLLTSSRLAGFALDESDSSEALLSAALSQEPQNVSYDVLPLAARTLLLALRVAPCAVRSFWEHLPRRRDQTLVEKLISRSFTPLLIQAEVAAASALLEAEASRLPDIQTQVLRRPRQLLLQLSREDLRAELFIQLPVSFPLRPAQAEVPEKMPGIPKPRVRNWILQARQVLSGQRPMAVGQAVLMWAQSFALFFKGVEDCPICYNVIQLTTQTIPRKACPTCKHKFHNECLYQWFRTSSKTTCPLCNQPF